MRYLLALTLSATCWAVWAQTPTSNPMPDGSRDMYLGLGAVSAPRYEGAERRKVSALPLLQVQWSNGLFISGTTAGMHLSDNPALEFGPLVALQMRRSEAGTATGVGAPGASTSLLPSGGAAVRPRSGSALDGMEDIPTRLQAGAFLNFYVAPQWRLTSSMLYGAGRERNGALLDLGVQRLASRLANNHTVSLEAGATVANRDYNMAFFGVRPTEEVLSGHQSYAASGGLKDAHLGVRWNWSLSPASMLATSFQATRLLGSAADSPLVERPTNLTVSTAIAYRF